MIKLKLYLYYLSYIQFLYSPIAQFSYMTSFTKILPSNLSYDMINMRGDYGAKRTEAHYSSSES